MRVKVLGSSGGIGAGLRTTSLLIDDDVLIDCGTGVGDLELDEMRGVRHVLLTHSHLDHIASLPLLIDTLFEHYLQEPLVVHCEPQTYEVLEDHIFNWKVWPDFFRLPNSTEPVMRFSPIYPDVAAHVGGKEILPIRVNHVVPGVGYRVADDHSSFAFTGDTTTNREFWRKLNAHQRLDLLIVECAFANRDRDLCRAAKHYCPTLLAADIQQLKHRPKTAISHLKPGEEDIIFGEIQAGLTDFDLYRLVGGDVFEL